MSIGQKSESDGNADQKRAKRIVDLGLIMSTLKRECPKIPSMLLKKENHGRNKNRNNVNEEGKR